jgi:hypothetical protein
MTLGAVVFCLLTVPSLKAGLYSVEEPPRGYKIPRRGVQAMQPQRFVREYLPELIQIPFNTQLEDRPDVRAYRAAREEAEKKRLLEKMNQAERFYLSYDPLRQQYQERKDRLERKHRQGNLTVEDRINLSYYLIRLGEPEKALGVLRDPAAQASGHFMVFANLATTYQLLAGRATTPGDRGRNLGNALVYLNETKRAWPRAWTGWSKEQLDWLKEAEKMQAALVRLRMKEARAEMGQPQPRDGNIPFSNVDPLFPVNFATGDEYEAGKLPSAEKAKLKGNEVALVQQLLTWLPTDSRLYWLLGELLNARGDVDTAAYILDDSVKNRLLSSVPLLRTHRNVLNEAAANRGKKEPGSGWLPSSEQLLLVGGGGGLIIALLVFLQIKEIRRRRQRGTAAPKS